MTSTNIDRHRDLLTRRLIEQVKNFNKEIFLQVANYLFFILIVLPFIVGILLYLFAVIFSGAIEAMQIPVLMDLKEHGWEFVTTNHIFHMIIFSVMAVVLILMIMHYFFTRIKFSPQQLKLAGYILAKVKKNQVVNYQTLHKEIEFRNLTYKQIDKVAQALQRLEHVHIEPKEDISATLIIRDSSW